MKKLSLILLLCASVFFTACQNVDAPIDTSEAVPSDISKIDFSSFVTNGDEFTECDVEDFETMVANLKEVVMYDDGGFFSKYLIAVHPEQITACYAIDDNMFAFVSQPNTYTGLTTVREWEKEGNTAWSGLLYKHAEDRPIAFLKLPKEDFNPIALYLEDESLILDVADDSGAGSGEGQLLRFVYPFAGLSDELLYKWGQESCTSYYVPETYQKDREGCEADSDRISIYEESSYGISFSYPYFWEKDESFGSLGNPSIRVSNQADYDGSCPEDYVSFHLSADFYVDDISFDEFVKENSEGYMNRTTIAGRSAYSVGGFGFESFCPQKGYVVDYGDNFILKIIFTGAEDSPDYAKLSGILNSLRLSGRSS